jgi:transcriptional regulator of heat shock response
MVSRAARHVGFAIGSTDVAVLQRVEFVPLGGTRVLVVVVSKGNHITQKVVDAGEPIRSEDLVEAANYLTSQFAGLSLLDVREAVLARSKSCRHNPRFTSRGRHRCSTLHRLTASRCPPCVRCWR